MCNSQRIQLKTRVETFIARLTYKICNGMAVVETITEVIIRCATLTKYSNKYFICKIVFDTNLQSNQQKKKKSKGVAIICIVKRMNKTS